MKKILLLITIASLSFSDGKLSGVMYFGYEDNFSLSRVYFTYKKSVSDDVSFKFQTDVGQVGTDDRWTAYLKKAHLNWKVADKTKISMGMIGMNMFNVQEKTWGHRFLAKSAMDGKFSSSADVGMSISKDFGFLYTNLTMTNGEGYKNSDVDDNNKTSLQLVHGERRLDKNDGYNAGLVYSTLKKYSNDQSDIDENTTVLGLFGGWAGKGLRIGAEYNTQNVNSKNISNGSVSDLKSMLTSLYVNYNINDSFSAFLRQDAYDADVDTDGDTSTMMAGLIWKPAKGLSICPNMTQVKDADGVFAIDIQFKF